MEEKYYSIGYAAKKVGTTSETLRHYDRIGLISPGKKDPSTGYRYYTEQDLVRINTVRALQIMGMSLNDIKKILEYDDLGKIIKALEKAERKADEKIAELKHSKAKIQLAKSEYEKRYKEGFDTNEFTVKEFLERTILLSDTLQLPTVDNLYNYLRHFNNQIPDKLKDKFSFENLAGVYTEDGSSRLFAQCLKFTDINGLKILPQGKYLCAFCSENDRKITIEKLLNKAKNNPPFIVEIIVITGILQWNYEIQIPLFS